VDALFGQLVHLVLTTPPEAATQVLRGADVGPLRRRLQQLCGAGEVELERAWADRIARSPRPADELARFPYLGNYRRLCRMELDTLAAAVDRPVRSVAFVGSGPLPLSSLLLADELGVPVVNLDRDAAAVAASRLVARALGSHHLAFRRVDADDADVSDHDVVVLAALVGDTPAAKRRVVRQLARTMAPGAALLARSARGLRTLLYPPLDLTDLAGFDLVTVVHPVHDVVNSAVLARARGMVG
jgi:nicotianamine synthase